MTKDTSTQEKGRRRTRSKTRNDKDIRTTTKNEMNPKTERMKRRRQRKLERKKHKRTFSSALKDIRRGVRPRRYVRNQRNVRRETVRSVLHTYSTIVPVLGGLLFGRMFAPKFVVETTRFVLRLSYVPVLMPIIFFATVYVLLCDEEEEPQTSTTRTKHRYRKKQRPLPPPFYPPSNSIRTSCRSTFRRKRCPRCPKREYKEQKRVERRIFCDALNFSRVS